MSEIFFEWKTTLYQSASRQSVLFGTCVCVRRKGVYELSRQQLSMLSTVLCDIFEVSIVGVIIATRIYLMEYLSGGMRYED